MTLRPLRIRLATTGLLAAIPSSASAQGTTYDGCGIECGLQYLARITGIAQGDLPSTLVGIIARILSFMGLLAVISVIGAGVMLILSGGDPERKERAKRMIWYTLIGLAVILCSRIIVGLATSTLSAHS